MNRRGGPIITAGGNGIRSSAGLGFQVNPGAGVLIITAGGIGDWASAGTGFQPVFGGLLGLIGIGAMTTSAGVPAITGTVRR